MDINNEIQEVIILAAGRSRRMEKLSKNMPKCLLEYDNEKILSRLVRQLKENGIKKIVITVGYKSNIIYEMFKDDPSIILVENKLYEEDINIYSMKLALPYITGPCVVFEADVIMEDDLIKYIVGSDFLRKSVWFTKGKFTSSQYGGILKSDKHGFITDIRITPVYNDRYANYSKITGIMRINDKCLEIYKELVNKYSKSTIKQYYLGPWIENLKFLECEEADISYFEFFSFNKPEEYYQVINKKLGIKQECPNYEFAHIEELRNTEEHDPNRVEMLYNKIMETNKWTLPLIVEKQNNMVLDGNHRLNVARRMGLKKVPVIYVNYDDVSIWSLRKEYKVSPSLVKKKVIDNCEIYPYKTVKHKYNFKIRDINIDLEELRND